MCANARQCVCCCLQLLTTAMNQASELFKSAEEGDLVASLRQCAASGEAEKVRELSIKVDEHSEHIQEVSNGTTCINKHVKFATCGQLQNLFE